jgi:hypothetical protein
MKLANRSWQSDLVARHPRLFQITENGRTCTPGYPAVGDGWRELIETAVGRIASAMSGAAAGWVRIVQINSKFGTLRFYWRGANLCDQIEVAITDAVALGEARSACTCETCGAPGILHSRGRWLATACPAHARGEPVVVPAGFENVHIVRTFDASHYPIAACRRYVRETDTFVDVDLKSLTIEEKRTWPVSVAVAAAMKARSTTPAAMPARNAGRATSGSR